MKDFLLKIGRRKYVLPIYEALVQTKEGRTLAKQIFNEAQVTYHSVTRNSVQKVLR